MRPKVLKVFPQLADVRIDYQWGGMIGITANRFQVGRLSQHPNVFYAQGYSGHGLNVTHWTAKLLAESIALGHSHGLDVFSAVPHLTFPGGKALRSPCWHWACCGTACVRPWAEWATTFAAPLRASHALCSFKQIAPSTGQLPRTC
jgi:hypothetical protein